MLKNISPCFRIVYGHLKYMKEEQAFSEYNKTHRKSITLLNAVCFLFKGT